MEINTGGVQIKKKKKRRFRNPESHIFFPLLLAAVLTESQNNEALIKKLLRLIILSMPNVLSDSVLSLIPPLLKSKSAEIACKSADIIGAASLFSFEMNEKIALEDEIVRSLILLLGSSARKVSMSACNAMLDLSTASVGRRLLLEFSAVQKLILCFIQAYKSSAVAVSISADVLLYKDDEYLISLLRVAIILINSCTIEQLKDIPSELSESFLVYLKRLWGMITKQRSHNTIPTGDWEKDFHRSNIKMNKLAESIFRLSIVCGILVQPVAFDMLKKRIFGSEYIGIERFLSSSWELSPLLLRDSSHASESQDDIFNTFIRFLGPRDEIPSAIPSILKYCTSCHPMESNELDILQVLEEVKNQLGCPLIYNQDIRVVKTQCRKGELHYFKNLPDSNGSMNNHILHINDIFKFEEAFREGYSIALRGMEFRFQTIATIADALASLFGQPSVGVNMYLTPCNSQGLARHSDDHCVFACQLLGAKRWTVFPKPHLQLPRLYEPLGGLPDLEAENLTAGQEFLLKEGDVLYIPRGFLHEAQTYLEDDEDCDATRFSLHLTLAIEVEPPFEWEGFMHVALYSWCEKQSRLPQTSLDSAPLNLHFATIKLLHVAIIITGNIDPTFRKACLVGASLLSSVSEDRFNNNRKAVFTSLLGRIETESNFSDVLKHIEASIKKNEDPLEQVRWMEDAFERETEKPSSLSILSADSRAILDVLNQHNEIAEDAFQKGLSKFCREVEFDNVHYKMLLGKYRKVRKQYSDGMLSLHCVCNEQTPD